MAENELFHVVSTGHSQLHIVCPPPWIIIKFISLCT